MKTKVLILLISIFSFIVFTGCSNDIENIIIIPGQNGEYVEKTGSNLIVNVGDNNYGQKARMLKTRASVNQETITITSNEQIGQATIGLYSNYAWNTYTNGNLISVGTSNGYLFAPTTLTTPYKTAWSVSNSVDNGVLTLTADKLDDKYYKPVPVTFWGNHKLVVSEVEKTLYDTSDSDWKDAVVTSKTKSVAISKAIEYANSGVKINLTLGTNGILGWYDKDESSAKDETVTTIKVTEDNISSLPTKNTKTYEIDGKEENIIQIQNDNLKEVGKYFHYRKGNAIKIAQDVSGYGVWHFIGEGEADDINYEITEVRIESSKSCVYKNDYQYTPSSESVTYKYELNENLLSGENATFSIMPTSLTTSIVILKCKITKYPTQEHDKFNWYIRESIKDNSPYIKVNENSTFYILGKISTNESTLPVGSPYKDTWNKGIYCPDVITNVNVHIDNLCVDGSVVKDPDGTDDTTVDKIYYNYDYDYGTMDGIWSIGK